MNQELQQKLYDKFPVIFQQKDDPATVTCMCWGVSTGDGWFDLIYTLCKEIRGHLNGMEDSRLYHIKGIAENNDYYVNKLVPAPVEPVVATQVKEKFAGLRFYYDGGDDYVAGLVAMAEEMSYRICEQCGNKGQTSDDGGWIRTECEPCKAKRVAARSQGI